MITKKIIYCNFDDSDLYNDFFAGMMPMGMGMMPVRHLFKQYFIKFVYYY